MPETIISSSVLIVIVILMRFTLKGKINPRLQYVLWSLVAIRLLMPFPVLGSPLSVLNLVDVNAKGETKASTSLPIPQKLELPGGNMIKGFDGSTGLTEIVSGETRDSAINVPTNTGKEKGINATLYFTWILGALVVGLWFLFQNVWFYTSLKKTRKVVKVSCRGIPIYQSASIKSPCLFGLRPAIYLHPETFENEETLKYILAHEITHYRHRDHLWSYVRCLCLALHWFNPLVWWAAVLSRRDCEIACDYAALNWVGNEHRKAYGNTLINMIEHRTSPSDLLLGATTMTSGKSGIKERVTMIAQKPKMAVYTLVAALLITTIAVGCTFTGAKDITKKEEAWSPQPEIEIEHSPAQEPETTNMALYERFGVTIAIPDEYMDQLLIDPIKYSNDGTLIMLYQKSTYEKYEGMGFLLGIIRFDEAGFEQLLGSADGSGHYVFAKDDSYYYVLYHATDVQAPDDYEAFGKLFAKLSNFMKEDLISRNSLIPFSEDELRNKKYTYDGEHITLNYYPYLAYNGSKEVVWMLTLSQPVKQGDKGIWCVERWEDENGNRQLYFPDENGIPSAKFYAAKQADSDAGTDKSWLEPKQVALKFVKKHFEHTAATAGSFE